MGNDGGSIPGRQDLVKEKAKDRKMENYEMVKQTQAKYCVLTKESLKKPIVGCKLGFLYNKEGLIQALLDKRLPKTFQHIKKLKDVKNLNVNILENKDTEETKVICPISMIEYNGLNTFYILWSCGCVISKKAIDELNMTDKCINCGEKVDIKTDLVNLNYTKEEREAILRSLLPAQKDNNTDSNKMLGKKRLNNGTEDNVIKRVGESGLDNNKKQKV
jgi:hypothetical protein